MVMYFSKHSVASTITTCFAVVMKFEGKIYAHVSKSFYVQKKQPLCDKIAFLYFTYTRFGENNSLNLMLIAVAHESDW